ncbi:MAG: prolipoprotein diacylglyceryl transferase [Chitinophagales bacterium]
MILHPIIFEIGNFAVYSYGLMLALGAALAVVLTLREAKKEGISEEVILDISILAILSGVIGSRLFYVFFYEWDYYHYHPWQILNLRSEGLVFYGAFIFGLITLLLYVRYKKLNPWKLLDLFSPYLALGYAIARIGCFLNGCCYGKPTSLPWGVVFPDLDPIPRHPTQIYSTILSLALFAILKWLFPRRKFNGEVFLVFLLGYSGGRFINEFFRENLEIFPGMTIGQGISLLIFVAAAIITFVILRKKRMSKDS